MEEFNLKSENYIKESDKNLDKKVVNILLSLGISPNLQGYAFLKESIKLAIYNPSYIGAITKITGVISKQAAIDAIEDSVPKGTEKKNVSAFEAGYALVE